jgi:hypothetical protein
MNRIQLVGCDKLALEIAALSRDVPALAARS